MYPYKVPCRYCPAEFIWAETENGSAMPVNIEPAADGNVYVAHIGGRPHAFVLAADQLAHARTVGTVLHLPHFATCPRAKEARKRP